MRKLILFYLFPAIVIMASIPIIYGLFGFAVQSDDSSDEMPQSRLDYELMMLRDPVTGKIPEDIRLKELEFARNLPGSLYYMKNGFSQIMSYDWQQRGPFNVGGRTRALGIDIRNESIIIAGAVSGGLWRSLDGGQSWTKTTKPDQLHSVSCLIQDTRPGFENNWYAGTGEFWGNSARISGDGIFKSTDNGGSWQLIPSTSSNNPSSWDQGFDYIWNIIIDPNSPANSTHIYAATAAGGIYRSTDDGTSWKSVLGAFGNTYGYFTDLAVTNNGVFYATISQLANQGNSIVSGIYRSSDGSKWTNINPPFMPKSFKRIVIGIAPSNQDIIYFASDSPGSGQDGRDAYGDTIWHSFWKYEYLSGDGSKEGGLWTDRSKNLPKPDKVRWHMNSQGSYNLVVAVHPDNPDVVFLGGTNLFRSNSAFAENDFTLIGGTCPDPDEDCIYHYRYPNHHADQHAITFSRIDSDIMFTGTDGGVHKTLDCKAQRVEWISLNNGFYTTQFYTVALDHAVDGTEQIIGGTQDNGTLYTGSPNNSLPWVAPSQGDGLSCLIADGGKLHYTSQNASSSPSAVRIYRVKLKDDWSNEVKTRIDPAGGKDFIWNCFFGLDPNNQSRMYLGGGKLMWRNNNLEGIPYSNSNDSTSINWDSLGNTRIDTDNPIVKRPNAVISAGDISKSPANVVYYGTTLGELFRLDNAHEGNPMPVNITGQNMPSNAFVSSISIDPEDASKVLVSFSNYNVLSIFFTTNSGESWTPVSGNLEEFPSGSGRGPAVFWIETLPVSGKMLYLAGTSTGLYVSSYLDGPYTVWQQSGAETIGNVVVKMIDSRASDGFTVIGTHGIGTFATFIKSLPSAPKAPNLIYPLDNAKGIMDTVSLSWSNSADAAFYKLQLASDSEFNNIIQEINGINNNSIIVYDLVQGRKNYYWRVLSKGAGGESSWSETFTFRSSIQSPEPVLPLNGAEGLVQPLTIAWTEVPFANQYRFQISDKIIFSNLLIDSVISLNSISLDKLKPNQKHYWRVTSIDDDSESLFSRTSNFRTASEVSAGEDSQHKGLQVFQNEPNPAAQWTYIKFSISQPGFVSIKVYNLVGKSINEPISRYFGIGNHNIYVNTSNIPSGVYFYEVKFNGRRIVNKFTIER